MAYTKTIWKNREVERPRTYTIQDNEDGTITLTPAEGQIIEPGTPLIAANLNNIEDGIEELDTLMADIEDKVIVESGSNNDGYYFKYADGTLVCYNNLVLSNVPITTPTGALFTSGSLIWNYPRAFTKLPTISITPRAISLRLFGQETEADNSNFLRFALVCTTSATAANIIVGISAIGRWK